MRNSLFRSVFKNISLPKISLINLFVNFICVVGVAFFSINIFNVIKLGIERYNLIKSEIDKLDNLRAQELQLKADLDWFSSLDFIESQSRDYLNLANKGDSILVVPEGLFSDVVNLSPSDEVVKLSPNIVFWIDLIF